MLDLSCKLDDDDDDRRGDDANVDDGGDTDGDLLLRCDSMVLML